MAITITYGSTISGGGVSIQTLPVVRTGSGGIALSETLDAAQAGELTTRTDTTSGTITMADGAHTIQTANVVDVYWDGGVRYGVTVGTVVADAVPISTGDGDDLPPATTGLTIVPQVTANIAIDGDNAKIVAIALTSANASLRTPAHIQLLDSSDAEVAEFDLVANASAVWDIEGGSANPFTGNPIAKVKISQGGSAADQNYTLKIVGVQDATP